MKIAHRKVGATSKRLVFRRYRSLQLQESLHQTDRLRLRNNPFIMPGVSIGENSVIGAGSIVTKDIPATVVAVGNPCKVLREITDRDTEYYFGDRRFDEQPE